MVGCSQKAAAFCAAFRAPPDELLTCSAHNVAAVTFILSAVPAQHHVGMPQASHRQLGPCVAAPTAQGPNLTTAAGGYSSGHGAMVISSSAQAQALIFLEVLSQHPQVSRPGPVQLSDAQLLPLAVGVALVGHCCPPCTQGLCHSAQTGLSRCAIHAAAGNLHAPPPSPSSQPLACQQRFKCLSKALCHAPLALAAYLCCISCLLW